MAQSGAFNQLLAPPLREGKGLTSPVVPKSQVSLRPTPRVTELVGAIRMLLRNPVQPLETVPAASIIPGHDVSRSPIQIVPQKQIQVVQAVQPIVPAQSLPSSFPSLVKHPIKPPSKLQGSPVQSGILWATPLPHPRSQAISGPTPRIGLLPEREPVVKRRVIQPTLRQEPLLPKGVLQGAGGQDGRSQPPPLAARPQGLQGPLRHQGTPASTPLNSPLINRPINLPNSPPNNQPTHRPTSQMAEPDVQGVKSANLVSAAAGTVPQAAFNGSPTIRKQPPQGRIDPKSATPPALKQQALPLINAPHQTPSSLQAIALPKPKTEPAIAPKPQPIARQPRPQVPARPMGSPKPLVSLPPSGKPSITIEIGRIEIIAKSPSKPPSPKPQSVRPRSHGIPPALPFLEGRS